MTDQKPASPALDVRKFDKEMDTAVSQVNKAAAVARSATPPPADRSNTPPEYRFMQLTDQVCEAMLEAARHQLSIAQNNMAATERQAEKMRQDAQRRWAEHDAYVRGLEEFGMSLLEANKKFQKTNGPA
jgi:LPS O-antigen subunit length determinant protein (WzzB/FepE family)